MIHLVKRNIYSLAKNKTYSFVVVILSTIVISYGVLFYAGYLLSSYYGTGGKITDTINIELTDTVSEQEIDDILQLFYEKKYNCIILSETPYIEETEKIVGAYYTSYEGRLLAGNSYSDTEEDACLLISQDMVMYGTLIEPLEIGKSPIGKEIEIAGQQLTITGVIDDVGEAGYEVPINYYKKHFTTKYIYVAYTDELSKSEIFSFTKELEHQSGIASYSVESETPPWSSISFWIQYVQILIIFLLMTLNLFFILVSWIRSERRKYNIYGILGCGKARRNVLIIEQNGILLFFGQLSGTILYLLTSDILMKLHIVYDMDIWNYIGIQGMYYLVVMLFLSIVVCHTNMKQDIYVMKE